MAAWCLEFMSGYWLCSCCYSKTPQAAGLHLSRCFTVSQSRNSAAHWLILQLCQISSLLPQSFCIAFHWILATRSPRWVSDAHTSIVKEGDGDGGWQQPLCISSRSCPSSWVTAEKRTKKIKLLPKVWQLHVHLQSQDRGLYLQKHLFALNWAKQSTASIQIWGLLNACMLFFSRSLAF